MRSLRAFWVLLSVAALLELCLSALAYPAFLIAIAGLFDTDYANKPAAWPWFAFQVWLLVKVYLCWRLSTPARVAASAKYVWTLTAITGFEVLVFFYSLPNFVD